MSIQELIAELGSNFHVEKRTELLHEIEGFEQAVGIVLPADYKYFLMWHGAGETVPPLGYRRIYPLDELLERNATGHPPNTLEFATDNSLGFAFDLTQESRTAAYPVVNYPLGESERCDLELEAADFAQFIGCCLEHRDR